MRPSPVQHIDEEALRRAFLWSETRKADKTGIFSLFGRRDQVGPDLARKKVDLRYDPERLEELKVWFEGRFRERVQPFQVQPNRRPGPHSRAQPHRSPGTRLSPPTVADRSLTTNKAFAGWNETFPNATSFVALVDRLVHRSEIVQIEGKSYRLKEARERAARRGDRARFTDAAPYAAFTEFVQVYATVNT